jgi:hypothetical protein
VRWREYLASMQAQYDAIAESAFAIGGMSQPGARTGNRLPNTEN